MKAYLFTNKNYCEPTSCVLQHKNKAEDEYRKKTCDCFTPKLLLKGSVMRESRKEDANLYGKHQHDRSKKAKIHC